jgi:hypothetical protein
MRHESFQSDAIVSAALFSCGFSSAGLGESSAPNALLDGAGLQVRTIPNFRALL